MKRNTRNGSLGVIVGLPVTVMVAVFLVCAFCCGFLSLPAKIGAKASNVTPDLDTDNITGTDFNITDYPEQLHATEAAVEYADDEYRFCGLDEDDPIVNIVPKNRFFTECNVLEMGEEYGYFINTVENENGNYSSTALVFNITTNTDLVYTTDRVIVEVNPIFQYKYVGLTDSATVETVNGYELDYGDIGEDRVVAVPSDMSFSSVEYEMTEEYYLKDVSFGASLYNEQALNRGDPGYDPYDDYGSYFTGFDYSYQGKYREDGEFNGDDIAWQIVDTVSFALGYMEFIPIVGNVLRNIGNILSVVSMAHGWIDIVHENFLDDEVAIAEKEITATCLYQNRDDQLKYYRDENDEPVLARTAIVAIDTDDDQSMWYGVGDNVTAYFNIGHAAIDGRTPYYMRFVNQLALQIVSSDGDEVVAADSTIIQDKLRDPETKEIGMFDSENIYMLSEGEDHLVYENVEYESDYTVSLDLTDSATVSVNGQTLTGSELSFNVYVGEHEDISIDLRGNAVGLKGSVSILPNDDPSDIGFISPGGKYILRTELSGIKSLDTDNTDLIIEDIFICEDGAFVSYESYIPFASGSSLIYPFDNGQDYYIIIHNTGAGYAHSISLQIDDIQSFVPGQSVSLSGGEHAMYFENTYDTAMSFQIVLPQSGGTNSLAVYNENEHSIASATVSSGEIKYSFALSPGEECNIFFSLETSVTFTAFPNDNYVKWEIDGEIYDLDYNTTLPRGESYTIRLLYCENGNNYELETDYNIDVRPSYFTFDGNVLTITYDVPYAYVITIVPIEYPNATLRITPTEGREDIDYEVTLDKMGGSGGDDVISANYNRDMPNAEKPSRPGYKFQGYYSEQSGCGIQYYDSNMLSVNKWDKETDAIIYAYWTPETYHITFDKNSGSGGTTSKDVIYGQPLPLIELPTRTGHNFLGYYTSPNGGTCYYEFFDSDFMSEDYYYLYYAKVCDITDNITLYARWEPMTWTVSVWVQTDNTGMIGLESFNLSFNERKIYYVSLIKDYVFDHWELTYSVGTVATGTDTAIDMTNLCVGNYSNYTLMLYHIYSPDEGCLAPGTLITLADGSQKAVEDLTGEEMLLVWDMETGTFGSAPIMFIDSELTGHYEVIELTFSDDTAVEVISEHGFWDTDLNKYVYLDENAEDYIGHSFLKQSGDTMTEVVLTDVEISTEITEAYSPVTCGHLCYYVNGMLSMPGGITGLINIFEVDPDTLTIDEEAYAEDIAEYGLYTYEEFSETFPVSEEVFEAFNGKYLKVAIGKGLITETRIAELIARYAEFF